MIRRILFQLHWALGISAGLILVVMSVTGVIMSFEDEIMQALSPRVIKVLPPNGAEPLSPDAMLARIHEQQPNRQVASLTLASGAADSARVIFERDPQDANDDRRSYVDPYDGSLLGPATGEHFFRTARELHRWLLIPGNADGFGRQLTGVAAISLIYFALSGLWLRWPKRPLDWRQWFVIDLKLKGRGLYRSLHLVIGTWLVLFYLLSGLTGLWWSYEWYKSGVTLLLTGAAEIRPVKPRMPGEAGKVSHAKTAAATPETASNALTAALSAIQQGSHKPYREVIFTLSKGMAPIRIRALASDARYDQAFDEYQAAPETGQIVKTELYTEKSTSQSLVDAWLSLHTGAYFGFVGRIAILLSTATLPLFAVTGWLLYLDRRKRKRRTTVATGRARQEFASR